MTEDLWVEILHCGGVGCVVVSLLTDSVNIPGLDISVRFEGDIAQPPMDRYQLVWLDVW